MSVHDTVIGPYVRDIIDQMFVRTADQDYIIARVAFLNGMDLNSLWNSVHSLEKYFKAILLYNGLSSKGYGHDVGKLFEKIKTLNPVFILEKFPEMAGDKRIFDKMSVKRYIEIINKIVSANNRYLTYGYTVHAEYLYCLDYIVWYYRRFCRKQFLEFNEFGKNIKIDIYNSIVNGDSSERLSGFLPIENLLNKKEPKLLYELFSESNFAFFKNLEPITTFDRWGARSSPLIGYFESIDSSREQAHVKSSSSEVLKWVGRNIFLPKSDTEAIELYLKKVISETKSDGSS
ncbi:HEPN domain-containing protein [Elstera sp.]|uniref:HEPN domain-containing protein n=1 Tax=Elstera sp. TaxID=1916664 RepID=UPI0037C193B6